MKDLIPPLPRFTLPQALEFLEPLGCRQEHLIEYLKSGDLRAVSFPYRKKPDHEIRIDPKQWKALYPESYGFSVYYGWFGDDDIHDVRQKDPLSIVADAVDKDVKKSNKDGTPVATAAVVYVMDNELQRFVTWYQTKIDDLKEGEKQDISDARLDRIKKRPGAPRKHDYSDIDKELDRHFHEKGKKGFDKISRVIFRLREELGNDSLPHDSTLRNHIRVWLKELLGS